MPVIFKVHPGRGTVGPGEFVARRAFDGFRTATVLSLPYGRAGLYLGGHEATRYDDFWEYASLARALDELLAWDPATEPEPAGWERHPPTGRYRPNGDPSREAARPPRAPRLGPGGRRHSPPG